MTNILEKWPIIVSLCYIFTNCRYLEQPPLERAAVEGGGGFARGLAGWCSGPCLVAGSPRVLEENNVKDTGLNRMNAIWTVSQITPTRRTSVQSVHEIKAIKNPFMQLGTGFLLSSLFLIIVFFIQPGREEVEL